MLYKNVTRYKNKRAAMWEMIKNKDKHLTTNRESMAEILIKSLQSSKPRCAQEKRWWNEVLDRVQEREREHQRQENQLEGKRNTKDLERTAKSKSNK